MPLISAPLAYTAILLASGYLGLNNVDEISTGINQLHNKVNCAIQECCHADDGKGWLKYKEGCTNLKQSLSSKIHGQPLIVEPIVNSIRRHLTNEDPEKALVIYFSGWTGTGKTYTSKLIASSLYKRGMESKYVKFISAVHHFPRRLSNPESVALFKKKLRDMVSETVSGCERSLIIIDEIDKLPAGVVDALKPMIDFNRKVAGVTYRKSIFLLMSNTGSEKLKEFAYYMYREGKSREDLLKNKKELETILRKEAAIEDGGLGDSTVLDNHLIDLFVPFLPLERQHVDQCTRDQIKAQNISVSLNDENEIVENIASELTFFPQDIKLYSKAGCKPIYEKVSMYSIYKEEL